MGDACSSSAHKPVVDCRGGIPFWSRLSFYGGLILVSCLIVSPLSVFFERVVGVGLSLYDDAALAVLLILVLVSGRLLSINKVILAVALFIGILLLSALVNNAPMMSAFLQARSYILPFSAYLCVVYLLSGKRFSAVFLAVLIGFSIILSLVGLFEMALGRNLFNQFNALGELSGSTFRVQSLIGHPADYGYYLLFPIVIAASAYQVDGAGWRKHRLSLLLLLILLLFNLAFTVSKGPLLALGVSAVLLFIFLFRVNRIRVLIMGLTFFGVALYVTYSSWVQRIDSFLVGVGRAEATYLQEASRVGFYLQSASVIKDNLLLGVGPGQFGGWVATSYGSAAHDKYGIDTFGISSIDVFYPHLMGELGLLGACAYFLIFGTILWTFILRWQLAGRLGHTIGQFYSAAAIWLTVIVLIIGFYSMINETFPHMIVYWALIGLAEVNTRVRQ